MLSKQGCVLKSNTLNIKFKVTKCFTPLDWNLKLKQNFLEWLQVHSKTDREKRDFLYICIPHIHTSVIRFLHQSHMFVTIDDPIWSNRNYLRGFPGGTVGKESACNVDVGWIPGSERSPRRKKWQPTAVFLPGKSHGQRSLAGYSPWGCKESDRLSTRECNYPQGSTLCVVQPVGLDKCLMMCIHHQRFSQSRYLFFAVSWLSLVVASGNKF